MNTSDSLGKQSTDSEQRELVRNTEESDMLSAKPTKCMWRARSLSYLGHMIWAGYTSVPEARIKAIKQ